MLLFVAILGVVGCLKFSASDVKAQELKKNKIVIAMKSDLKTLDPQKSIDTISNKSITLIYDTLVDLDENLNLKPNLVESWERLDEYNVVFHLKKDVKFHNGEERKSLLYQEVQNILQEDLAIYAPAYPKINLAKNKDLKGLVFKKNGDIDITKLSF